MSRAKGSADVVSTEIAGRADSVSTGIAGSGDRVRTGIDGLDHILGGGLPPGRLYLVQGGPGAGKSTLGTQFLLEGVARGERVLYVTLLQTQDEVTDVFRSHDWPIDGIEILELPHSVREAILEEQTMFSTAEVELETVSQALFEAIEGYRPQRLLLDSVGELAVLVDTPYQLRRLLLRLKQPLVQVGCTTLFTAGDARGIDIPSLETLVHGMIALQQHAPAYGSPVRRLEVTKLRGISYLGGLHDFRIRTGGLDVYPRTEVHHLGTAGGEWSTIASGNTEMDTMLGGGLEEGTACLLVGTTGAGKSTLAAMYAAAAADRGERAVIFCFDERRETFMRRTAALGMPVGRHIEQGLLDLRQVNVGELSAGEFAYRVRQAVDQEQAKVVVIDSLTGYEASMPGEHDLMVQMHELLSYLGAARVLTIMVVAVHGSSAAMEVRAIDTSYIADTVVYLRHFEAMGAMRRCISVLKKRHGAHENTIRELQIGPGGLVLGPPLREFSGLLTGTPVYHGDRELLFDARRALE